MRYRHFLILSLMALLLTACAVASAAPAPEAAPTPEPEFAYFTVVVTRIGEQAPSIGWYAAGQVDLKVLLSGEDEGLNVTGAGLGMAGFDASTQICIDQGGWPIEYSAQGTFDADNCELNIIIEETWPKTEGYAVCFGHSGSASGGIYQLTFPSLSFKEDDPREDTEITRDMITWINSFLLYQKDGWAGSGCDFAISEP